VIKARKMRGVGHEARMEEWRGVCRVLLGKPEGKRDPDVDGRIILRWIFRQWDAGLWTGSSRFKTRTGDLRMR